MNRHHVKDKLSEYIDGMLNQEDTSSVKEHLDRCPECMEEFEEMLKIIGHMNRMESLETPEFFVEKVHERIKERSFLQRLAKGLFFPLKIKVPLELAGVAAAALLVIYIVGMRGKQQVYELAYVQRSRPQAVLQERRVDRETEIDETEDKKIDKEVAPSERDQPAMEFEEKKSDKKDKRIAVEKEFGPNKVALSAQAPQEKRIERRGKVEETVETGKMVQEEAEPLLEPQEEGAERKPQIETQALRAAKPKKGEKSSLGISDKEKERAEEDAFLKPTPKDITLKDMINSLGGKIIESEYNEDTQVLESLKIEIPAEKYPILIQRLEDRGDVQKPYPAIKEKDREIVTVRLVLHQ